MSVQVSYNKQIILFLFLFLILLFSIEIGFRTLEYFEESVECKFIENDALKNIDESKQDQICKDNNSIKYEVNGILRLMPNQNMDTININSYGFRGDDFLETKDFEVFRIFVIGGSTIFGSGSTSDDSTIPSLLQKNIFESELNPKIEIINAGIGSAYSYSEKYLIENNLLKFQPDLMIIYSGGNDANNRFGQEYSVPGMNLELVTAYEGTNFVSVIKKLIVEMNYRTPIAISKIISSLYGDIPDSNNSNIQVQELWTTRMNEICEGNKKNGINTIIILQPMLGSGNKDLSDSEKILLESYGVNMEDTLKILDKMSASLTELEGMCDGVYDFTTSFDDISESVFYDHIHVNNLGNEIIANKIYQKILSDWLEDISK